MLTVIRTPPEQMLAAHARARAKVARPRETQSQVHGALEVVRLLDKREFIFHGRPYQVPPVPWPLAAELTHVQERIRTMGPSTPLAETLEVFARAAALSKKTCHPAGFLRRLLWPLTPNPFAKATPWQVGRNLGFFCMCLVLDGDLPATAQANPAPGTSNPTSPASSRATRNGRGRTASRSRGRTS